MDGHQGYQVATIIRKRNILPYFAIILEPIIPQSFIENGCQGYQAVRFGRGISTD